MQGAGQALDLDVAWVLPGYHAEEVEISTPRQEGGKTFGSGSSDYWNDDSPTDY